MATTPKFRIDVDIHSLLMDSSRQPVKPAAAKGLTLPEPVFPQYTEKLADPGQPTATQNRHRRLSPADPAMRQCHLQYARSPLMPGESPTRRAHPFVPHKCQLEC